MAIKRIRLQCYLGIDSTYRIIPIRPKGWSGDDRKIYLKNNKSITKEKFDDMTTKGLKGRESWSKK